MFQTAELGQKVSKSEFKQRQLSLRKDLLDLQRDLRDDNNFPVLIDFAGVRGAGKGTSTNILHKWMDTRWILTHGYLKPSEEEADRPRFWRYWRDLPPRGQIGIYLHGRYSRPLLNFVYGITTHGEFVHELERINNFEKSLADDGALILKYWMHISRDVQKERLQTIENDSLRSWRMGPEDWKHWEMYDQFIEAAEEIISRTNTGHAPWFIVEGEDFRYRSLRVGDILRDSLDRHLKMTAIKAKYVQELSEEIPDTGTEVDAPVNGSRPVTILDGLDLTKKLSKQVYRQELKEGQARLATLHAEAIRKKLSTILVFEGPDAGGKGGAIRQVTQALDARYYKVIPIAAPTDEENAHHYLWRFWRHMPRAGRMTVFDRSWYGRVLVERIERFATNSEWRRAYVEINDFEEQLLAHGAVLLKFWMHISKQDQVDRFKAREQTPHKRWKLTEEDWRNHERYDEYKVAAHDMIEQTSKLNSPWILVENRDKPYGRIQVLNTVCDAMEKALGSEQRIAI